MPKMLRPTLESLCSLSWLTILPLMERHITDQTFEKTLGYDFGHKWLPIWQRDLNSELWPHRTRFVVAARSTLVESLTGRGQSRCLLRWASGSAWVAWGDVLQLPMIINDMYAASSVHMPERIEKRDIQLITYFSVLYLYICTGTGTYLT